MASKDIQVNAIKNKLGIMVILIFNKGKFNSKRMKQVKEAHYIMTKKYNPWRRYNSHKLSCTR